MLLAIIILVCTGEILTRFIVAKQLENEDKGALAAHCFNLIAGSFLYELGRQNIEFDGAFYELEKWHYFLSYYGLIILVVGIVGVIWVFYRTWLEKTKQ